MVVVVVVAALVSFLFSSLFSLRSSLLSFLLRIVPGGSSACVANGLNTPARRLRPQQFFIRMSSLERDDTDDGTVLENPMGEHIDMPHYREDQPCLTYLHVTSLVAMSQTAPKR